MATIVILEHALQRHVDLPYMVKLFAGRWRERGHTVVVHHGAENPPPGDLAILHIDLTVVPKEYRALVACYPRVINGSVFDVSKSRISRDLVRPHTIWRGPVIVKTEANFGGKPEQLFRSIAAEKGERSNIPAGPVAEGYPIYDSMSAVPDMVWRTPGLIVEKFLPERDERGYYVRVWVFFGDRERSARWRAAAPIVKAGNLIERDAVDVPEEIRARRAELGFDFGKFDYVLHGERWVLLDVNRTPSAPTGPALNPQVKAGLSALADGVEAMLQ
jgi:hypothetical protein